MRGFLPASLVDIRRVPNLDEYMGTKIECKVIELNRSRNNVVLSRRAVLEEERKEQRQEILDRLQPGLVVEGQISNIVDFGAFVDLNGIDGLIHISELSWSHVNHPSEILNIGDTVQVKVLDIDRDRQRISLGLKQTQEDPWQRVVDTYRVGDELEGTVTKVVTFGAFVEILDGVEGLVHISELANHHVENPREVVQPGDDVRVKILEIDSERRRLSLSVKRVEGQVLPRRARGAAGRRPSGAGDLDDVPDARPERRRLRPGAPTRRARRAPPASRTRSPPEAPSGRRGSRGRGRRRRGRRGAPMRPEAEAPRRGAGRRGGRRPSRGARRGAGGRGRRPSAEAPAEEPEAEAPAARGRGRAEADAGRAAGAEAEPEPRDAAAAAEAEQPRAAAGRRPPAVPVRRPDRRARRGQVRRRSPRWSASARRRCRPTRSCTSSTRPTRSATPSSRAGAPTWRPAASVDRAAVAAARVRRRRRARLARGAALAAGRRARRRLPRGSAWPRTRRRARRSSRRRCSSRPAWTAVYDATIAVVADEDVRAERAAARGHAAVDERAARQLTQDEKAQRARRSSSQTPAPSRSSRRELSDVLDNSGAVP